jgi:hypothetical protein
MSRGLAHAAVVFLLVMSFALVAAHAHLLRETPSEQQECPLCRWLRQLADNTAPAPSIAVGPLVGPASREPVRVVLPRPSYPPFSARAPPCA